jgi:CheY-like chemotaxis protein
VARLLVVDDDLTITNVLRDVFERLGHDVRTCNDGLDAIALLDAQIFDAVVADWQMGAFSGLDVLEVAWQKCPLARRILVTASPTEPEVLEALRTGVAEVLLEKPWFLPDIRAAVRGL